MRRKVIQDRVDTLAREYGADFVPYGTSAEETEGTGFRLAGIPATFSVLSFGQISSDILDYQIESSPPGDYLRTGEARLHEFLDLIEEYRRPMKNWPDATK